MDIRTVYISVEFQISYDCNYVFDQAYNQGVPYQTILE